MLPCVKRVTGQTIYHKLLEEMKDVTRPERFPRETKHITRYHIETTLRPPRDLVACRPYRLAPKRLTVEKNEFSKMLKSGIIRPSKSN